MGKLRSILATVAALIAAVVMRSWHGHDLPLGLWIPAMALALTAIGLHLRSPAVQLVVRSVWWANLMLGTMIAMIDRGRDGRVALVLALSTGVALLAQGRAAVEEDAASTFRPVAFRTALSLSMVMAVADAQALSLFGALQLEGALGHHLRQRAMCEGALLFGCAVAVALAAYGLYRLRVWGLLLNTVCNVAVLTLAIGGGFGIRGPLATMIAASAFVQLLLPLPMIVAIARRTPASVLARPSRLARFAPAFVIVGMMGSAAASTFGLMRF